MNDNLEHLSISLPDQKNYEISYGLAFKLASEKLSGTADLEEQCHRSDSICHTENTRHMILLKYLNKPVQVVLPEMQITFQDSAEELELRDKILILHYLTQAKGLPLTGNLIAYQELREGAAYYPSFFKRAVKPIIDYFGANPERIYDASEKMGGYKASLRDVSVIIPAFSRVPITLVIWRGDDEFPPNANILFDSTILDNLPVEDINVLCQLITWQLIKS
jgi:hypothetical protein